MIRADEGTTGLKVERIQAERGARESVKNLVKSLHALQGSGKGHPQILHLSHPVVLSLLPARQHIHIHAHIHVLILALVHWHQGHGPSLDPGLQAPSLILINLDPGHLGHIQYLQALDLGLVLQAHILRGPPPSRSHDLQNHNQDQYPAHTLCCFPVHQIPLDCPLSLQYHWHVTQHLHEVILRNDPDLQNSVGYRARSLK